jgi:hypothetical protein
MTNLEAVDADGTSALQHTAIVRLCSAHVPWASWGAIIAIVE